MKALEDKIREAVQRQDAAIAGGVADFMRFRLGLTYAQSFKFVQRVCPDIEQRDWDALLREADEG